MSYDRTPSREELYIHVALILLCILAITYLGKQTEAFLNKPQAIEATPEKSPE